MTSLVKTHVISGLAAAAAVFVALLLVVGVVRPAFAAGWVEVKFVAPQRYADAGRGELERQQHLDTLARHFQALAPRLRDGQALRVEVLDVDLAGELEPFRADEARIARGRADPPRLHLRWVLAQGGREVAHGEDRLSDLGYLSATPDLASQRFELPYERRLIERWFRERVERAGPASAP